jgi:hypothetical protein
VNFYLLQAQDQEISFTDFEKVCAAVVQGKASHEAHEEDTKGTKKCTQYQQLNYKILLKEQENDR